MKRQSDSPANAVSGWYPRNRGRQFGSCETGRGVVARGDGCGGAAATRNTRLQYVLYEDGGVHCGVAEEEEHRDQRGDGVDVAEHDAAKGDHECGDERAPRLAAALEEFEGGHQVVVGDACSSRGAPVSDCRPAPSEERTMPTRTSQSLSEIVVDRSGSAFRASRSATAPKSRALTR